MLTSTHYYTYCRNIFPSKKKSVVPGLTNYADYQAYENLWNNYLQNIVSPALNINKNKSIRLIFCESAPAPKVPTIPHPNPNYIFNSPSSLVSGKTDIYLHQIWKGIKCSASIPPTMTKVQALEDIAKDDNGPVIIIDLLPTHGIKLNTLNRKRVVTSPSGTIDLNNFIHLLIPMLHKVGASNRNIKALFASPPTIANCNVTKLIDTQFKSAGFTKTDLRWTCVNNGSGFAPSWNALRNEVSTWFN